MRSGRLRCKTVFSSSGWKTASARHTARLRTEVSLRGAFYRQVMQSGLPDSECCALLKLGFAALDGTREDLGADDADTGSIY